MQGWTISLRRAAGWCGIAAVLLLPASESLGQVFKSGPSRGAARLCSTCATSGQCCRRSRCDCCGDCAGDCTGVPGTTRPDDAAEGMTEGDAYSGAREDMYSGDLVSGSFGATAGSLGATPNVIGDFFGGGLLRAQATTTVASAFHTTAFILSGTSGDPNAVLAFEANGGAADDFTSMGVGVDLSGDGLPDTFAITEPLPPNEVPTSPGPGFVFDGGTAGYTVDNSNTTPQDGAFDTGSIFYAQYSFSETLQLLVPNGGGAAVRRIKIAENNSPIPRDRLIFDYNFFNDVMGGLGDVRRYTLGFEKTFFDGTMSFDLRFPYASTLDSVQTVGVPSPANSEFGNMTVVWKTILIERRRFLVSGGVGVALPTADDTRVSLPNGTDILELDNRSVHVQPYFAALWLPNDRWFTQMFLQVDVDTNGNPVAADINGGALPSVGKLHDASLLFADFSTGYWLYRNPCACTLRAVAPIFELHYSTTLQDADAIVANGLTLTSITNRFDVLNMTLGVHTLIGNNVTVTPAMSIPLRRDDDRQFDFEAAVLANWYF